MKFKKIIRIKFRPLLLWQFGVIAFLLFIAILFVLNIRLLIKTDRELNYFKESDLQFEPKTINKALLEDIVSKIENREEIFNKALLEKPEIKDPSM